MDKVSIIVPVYNGEKFIEKCIQSLLQQTYQNLEIIVVDDGSNDGTANIIKSIGNKDNRIIILHKNNGGLSSARNAGLELATGKYLSSVDADDFISDEYVEKLLTAVTNNDCDIAVCNLFFVEDEEYHEYRYYPKQANQIYFIKQKTFLQDILYHRLEYCFFWGKIYRTDAIKSLTFYDVTYVEDTLFAVELLLTPLKRPIVFLKDPLYYYVQQKNSIMHTERIEGYRDICTAANIMVQLALQKSPEHLLATKNLAVTYALFAYIKAAKLQDNEKVLTEAKNIIKKYRMTVLLDPKTTIKTRIASFLSLFSFRLLVWIYNIMQP